MPLFSLTWLILCYLNFNSVHLKTVEKEIHFLHCDPVHTHIYTQHSCETIFTLAKWFILIFFKLLSLLLYVFLETLVFHTPHQLLLPNRKSPLIIPWACLGLPYLHAFTGLPKNSLHALILSSSMRLSQTSAPQWSGLLQKFFQTLSRPSLNS